MQSTQLDSCRLLQNRKFGSGRSSSPLRSICSSTTLTSRSKLGREDIKWQELLIHFRNVQAKHEKARRQTLGTDSSGQLGVSDLSANARPLGPTSARPPLRRKVTGDTPPALNTAQAQASGTGPSWSATLVPPRTSVLSPLNPKARTQAVLSASMSPAGVNAPAVGSPPPTATGTASQKQKRAYSLSRKA
jgi:vacuole morphology and inheritance protein 14